MGWWPELLDAGALARMAAQPFVSPFSRTGILVLLIGWLIGAAAYRFYIAPGERLSWRNYIRFSLPASIYRTRSFALDLQLLLFNHLLKPARWITMGVSVSAAAAGFAYGFGELFGPSSAAEPMLSSSILMIALLVLAYDLGTYVTHRMSHAVPLLWAFHRVHHSAETLNPLTLARKHPVYDAVAIMIDCLVAAPLQGLILYLWGAETALVTVMLTNLAFGIFALAASSLRHSHIWLSFGPVLDRIFVSPALHQIHHSKAERHWDRNFGEVFALWDLVFGTLYAPKQRESLEFGLGDCETQPHTDLKSALLEPFAFAGARFGWGSRRRPPVGTEAVK